MFSPKLVSPLLRPGKFFKSGVGSDKDPRETDKQDRARRDKEEFFANEYIDAIDLLMELVGRDVRSAYPAEVQEAIAEITQVPPEYGDEDADPEHLAAMACQRRYLQYFVERVRMGADAFYAAGKREETPELAERLAGQALMDNMPSALMHRMRPSAVAKNHREEDNTLHTVVDVLENAHVEEKEEIQARMDGTWMERKDCDDHKNDWDDFRSMIREAEAKRPPAIWIRLEAARRELSKTHHLMAAHEKG